jgi:hypothetical protein
MADELAIRAVFALIPQRADAGSLDDHGRLFAEDARCETGKVMKEPPEPRSIGAYRDRFRRTRDGWRVVG